ncbi:MAG: hypothetical protein WKG00_14965 [Polyangiaceae bacterium]
MTYLVTLARSDWSITVPVPAECLATWTTRFLEEGWRVVCVVKEAA